VQVPLKSTWAAHIPNLSHFWALLASLLASHDGHSLGYPGVGQGGEKTREMTLAKPFGFPAQEEVPSRLGQTLFIALPQP
jgi:hypothetical protein